MGMRMRMTPRKRKTDQLQEDLASDRAHFHDFMDAVQTKVSKSDVNPIHKKLAMMSNIRTSMSDAAVDQSLTPNTKQELLAALAYQNKEVAKEIIELTKKK